MDRPPARGRGVPSSLELTRAAGVGVPARKDTPEGGRRMLAAALEAEVDACVDQISRARQISSSMDRPSSLPISSVTTLNMRSGPLDAAGARSSSSALNLGTSLASLQWTGRRPNR